MPTNNQTGPSEYQKALKAALHRIRTNPHEFDAARKLRLPSNKTEFPKLALLDTKHWIDLAKSHYGKSSSPSDAAALDAIHRAIKSGKLVVPCMATNIDELATRNNDASRLRAAEFVVTLSANYACMWHVMVLYWEVFIAVQTQFRGAAAPVALRTQLVRWGFNHAQVVRPFSVGIPVLDQHLNLASSYPECSVFSIVHCLDRQQIQDRILGVAGILEQARRVRALDAGLSPTARLRAELDNSGRQILDPLLAYMGIERASFDVWLAEGANYESFWAAVPTLNALVTLFVEQHKNGDAATKLNDVWDCAVLQVGLPYANLVGTDKAWHDVVTRTRLDAQHDCRVISKLNELPDALRALGCI